MTTLISKIADYSHPDLIYIYISISNNQKIVTNKGTCTFEKVHNQLLIRVVNALIFEFVFQSFKNERNENDENKSNQ